MIGRLDYENRTEVLQGTLDMRILQALQWGPMRGYGVAQTIRLKSSEVCCRWRQAPSTHPCTGWSGSAE